MGKPQQGGGAHAAVGDAVAEHAADQHHRDEYDDRVVPAPRPRVIVVGACCCIPLCEYYRHLVTQTLHEPKAGQLALHLAELP